MGRKAKARVAREANRLQQFELAKEKLLARVVLDEWPRIEVLPQEEQMRLAVGIDPRSLEIPDSPRTAATGSRMAARVSWCVRRRDVDGAWTWGDARNWSDAEWNETIAPAFGEFEKLTWGEVQGQVSGAGHLMHHEQEISTIADEAQRRWLELDLEEFDTLFRFRLGNRRRFWGFVLEGHFFGVWWDRSHRIYPT